MKPFALESPSPPAGFHSSEWSTPPTLFQALDAEFHFTLDVCATADNAKCPKFFTLEQDGLKEDWGRETA